MLALTYNTLENIVLSYIKRPNDTAAQAMYPTWVALAESRISRELKFLVNKTVVSSAFTSGAPVVVKPSNWRVTFGINYGSGTSNNVRTTIYPIAYEAARSYWPDDTLTAPPVYYSDYDYSNFLITPTPDQAYPFELSYYGDPAPLSTTTQINWYTQNVPELLLYAVLLETPMYLKTPDQQQLWQTTYAGALAAYREEQHDREIDQSTLRTDGS